MKRFCHLRFVEIPSHLAPRGVTNTAACSGCCLISERTLLCFPEAPLGSLVGNRWSCRVAVMLGGLLSSCGLLLSSFATSLEFLYFSMGILTGSTLSISFGCPCIPVQKCLCRNVVSVFKTYLLILKTFLQCFVILKYF